MGTRALLEKIAENVERGETEFQILASGQHDIGTALWNRDGRELRFKISNPGQRVGAMCLPGTRIIVDGPAAADVGWLNVGGIITVKGDAGDTAGHCAAGGKIYIAGRAGTRSGSLMKRDPLHEPPELWILRNVGSFSFEFMSGGIAVVCGHESQTLSSVLGERPCVGMVGGTVYFRGPHGDLPGDLCVRNLDDQDIAWLNRGLALFLQNISQEGLQKELSIWRHWKKIQPKTAEKIQGASTRPSQAMMARFRMEQWFEGGLFGDVFRDDLGVNPLVADGADRLRGPVWNEAETCNDCRLCLQSCPRAAILRRKQEAQAIYSVNERRCIGCGFCAAVCPCGVWQMREISPQD